MLSIIDGLPQTNTCVSDGDGLNPQLASRGMFSQMSCNYPVSPPQAARSSAGRVMLGTYVKLEQILSSVINSPL